MQSLRSPLTSVSCDIYARALLEQVERRAYLRRKLKVRIYFLWLEEGDIDNGSGCGFYKVTDFLRSWKVKVLNAHFLKWGLQDSRVSNAVYFGTFRKHICKIFANAFSNFQVFWMNFSIGGRLRSYMSIWKSGLTEGIKNYISTTIRMHRVLAGFYF